MSVPAASELRLGARALRGLSTQSAADNRSQKQSQQPPVRRAGRNSEAFLRAFVFVLLFIKTGIKLMCKLLII